MHHRITFPFEAQVWVSAAPGSWYFVTLPQDLSAEIRTGLRQQEEGWGRLKVVAKIGEISWETAIWFDRKHESYLLPLKAMVRKKMRIETGDVLQLEVLI